MKISIRKDDDGYWLYLKGTKQALIKLESQSGMIHEMLEEAIASDHPSLWDRIKIALKRKPATVPPHDNDGQTA
jgi:hypothetical protein